MATTTIQYSHKNREFIESLYLLLNIGQVEALARMLQVPVLIRSVHIIGTISISYLLLIFMFQKSSLFGSDPCVHSILEWEYV